MILEGHWRPAAGCPGWRCYMAWRLLEQSSAVSIAVVGNVWRTGGVGFIATLIV
jgi:hypothetical protein